MLNTLASTQKERFCFTRSTLYSARFSFMFGSMRIYYNGQAALLVKNNAHKSYLTEKSEIQTLFLLEALKNAADSTSVLTYWRLAYKHSTTWKTRQTRHTASNESKQAML